MKDHSKATSSGPARGAHLGRTLVVLNARSGTMRTMGAGKVVALVREKLSSVADLDVQVIDGRMPEPLARRIERGEFDCVVAGGGDGSISSMAGRLAESSTVMGILPLGTMNMISRVLGYPQDLHGALDALARARPQRIDLGEINGETFVRQVSFGMQPRMARIREKLGYSNRVTKILTGTYALGAVLASPRNLLLEAHVPHRKLRLRSPAVIVTNNEVHGGQRLFVQDHLTDGMLVLYALPELGPIAIFRLALSVLRRRWEESDVLTIETAATLKLAAERQWMLKPKQITAAVDGEVKRFALPLTIRIRAGALNVLVPRESTA